MRVHNFKYKKQHKVRVLPGKVERKRVQLLHGTYALVAQESFRVSAAQLESARKAIKKVVKKLGILYLRVEADRPITSKPAEVRMGKGKGSYSGSVGVIGVGTVLFELGGSNLTAILAYKAFSQAAERLPFKTKVQIFKN